MNGLVLIVAVGVGVGVGVLEVILFLTVDVDLFVLLLVDCNDPLGAVAHVPMPFFAPPRHFWIY